MTAEPQGWWTDEPAEESFAREGSRVTQSPTSGGPASENPISGVPAEGTQRPGAATDRAASRADASAFLKANVADGIAWARARAVPVDRRTCADHPVPDAVARRNA
jgi:hypothetical protein